MVDDARGLLRQDLRKASRLDAVAAIQGAGAPITPAASCRTAVERAGFASRDSRARRPPTTPPC